MSLLSSYNPKPHVVLFPFMSKGHIIPLLHLARLLLDHRTTVTLFTTLANRPYIVQSLSDDGITIIDLPFPGNISGILPGIESTDKLPSMSLFVSFARATKLMQPNFENVLQALPYVTCIISDQFLHWTLESATKFSIPSLGFNGMSAYSSAICQDAVVNGLLSLHESLDEPFTLTSFPWIKTFEKYYKSYSHDEKVNITACHTYISNRRLPLAVSAVNNPSKSHLEYPTIDLRSTGVDVRRKRTQGYTVDFPSSKIRKTRGALLTESTNNLILRTQNSS
ncbi:Glycosyltransferase [Forsythia ovata]|uniref:Glycosyltransferase n=1 Tax=Forsythia ovata TaxID=205694 RepID=A0ABD1WIR4_9LAMI